jgi:hypothetical protein
VKFALEKSKKKMFWGCYCYLEFLVERAFLLTKGAVLGALIFWQFPLLSKNFLVTNSAWEREVCG